MDTGNGNDFVAALQVFDEFFLVLGAFGLGPDKEHPEYEDHQPEEDELEAPESLLAAFRLVALLGYAGGEIE